MNSVDLTLVKTKITELLGYFPAFLIPALEFPAVFHSLVNQTCIAYQQNLLPIVLKEKLFIYLSRYYSIDYFTICHSCTLRSLEIAPAEILALGEIAYPQTEADVQADLKFLRSRIKKDSYPAKKMEASILRCTSLVFADPSQSAGCIKALQRLLGIAHYNYLVILLGYIKLCHQWVKHNPQIDHAQDPRSQKHLGSLLLSETKLADFFRTPKNSPNRDFGLKQALQLSLSSQATTESVLKAKSPAEFQPETFRTLTSYLKDFPFPVMIYSDAEEILFLNQRWIETTGYNMSEISTLEEWRQKTKLTIKSEIVKTASNISDTGSLPIERYSSQIRQIAAETKTTLQKIINSLIAMVTGITQDRAEETTLKEVSIITKPGIQRFWQLHSSCLLDELSSCQLTITIAKDITDIHQANLKLRQICEATRTTNWDWNLKTNLISLGCLGSDILGLDNFDGSYSNFISSIHPDRQESVDLSIVKAIQTKENLNLEFPIVKPDRHPSWISLQGKLNYSSQGEAIELAGIIKDITQDKVRTETANNIARITPTIFGANSSHSTQELASIFELIPHYIFVVDLGKTLIYANQGIVRGFDLPGVAQVQGKNINECFPSEYIRQIAWLHQQAITYGAELRIQEEVTLADGVHYFNTVITPIKNERAEVVALLHTSNDIPNLAATQEALSERTIQLEAANKELESFSYSVSHDLQAPLRVINGFSQVLWENYQAELSDRGKHFIERIQANSQKMSDLIDALLELSRVTRSQMKSVNVNLSAIAQEIVEELQAQSSQRQVEVQIAPELQTTGDPQLLRIVLNNLLNNAWKYTSRRSQAKIEFNILDRHDTDLIYYVRDNGAGFDSEYVDKLFTAFQRLHTQTEFPGTGIGLATVQRIIYRHGGRVWAEGESDCGATIYFAL